MAILFPAIVVLYLRLTNLKDRSGLSIDTSQARIFLILIGCVSLAMTLYNLGHHVPILFDLARKDREMGKVFVSPLEGLKSALFERNKTAKYFDWMNTWLWQGAYFSFGSWTSMFMATGPRLHLKLTNV